MTLILRLKSYPHRRLDAYYMFCDTRVDLVLTVLSNIPFTTDQSGINEEKRGIARAAALRL